MACALQVQLGTYSKRTVTQSKSAQRSSQYGATPFCVVTRHEVESTCEADEPVRKPPAKMFSSPTTCAVGWWSDHAHARGGGGAGDRDGATRCPLPVEVEGAPPPPPPGIEIVGDGPTELRSELTGRLDGLLIPLVVHGTTAKNATGNDAAVLVKVRRAPFAR